MPAAERLFDAGTRRAERALRELSEEFREARLRLGLSQREVAQAARIHRTSYTRIEAAKLPSLSLTVAARIAAVLGLELAVRAFPGGRSVRDVGQAQRLLKLIECIGPPLKYRTDVPLPAAAGRFEQRAWDLVIYGHGARTATEFEARLYDTQAQVRRFLLKRRDDPVDTLLIVVSDTKANRRVLDEFADLLVDFPRLRTQAVLDLLRQGQHPPSGLIVLSAPRPRVGKGLVL